MKRRAREWKIESDRAGVTKRKRERTIDRELGGARESGREQTESETDIVI